MSKGKASLSLFRQHGLQVATVLAVVACGIRLHGRWLFIDNAAPVTPGRVYRSSQPRGRQWSSVRRIGPARVANLRPAAESPRDFEAERRAAAEMDADLCHIPVQADLPSPGQLRAFLRLCGRGPTLVHCQHGEDRTGVFVAAYRMAEQGWPMDKALAEMRRYRCRLSEGRLAEVRSLLASVSPGR